MTVRDMKELVERLGEIKKDLKTLEKEEEELTSELKDGLLKKGYGYAVESEKYIASLSPTKSTEVIEDLLFKKVSIEDYRKCCKPQIGLCKEILSKEILDKVSIEGAGKDKLNLKSK